MNEINPHKQGNNHLNQDIFCPDCHARLSPELVDVLLQGKTVYCEMCGFPFIGIEHGEVKPLDKSPDQKFDTPVLNKQEQQWIKWKKIWNDIKKSFMEEWQTQKTKFDQHLTKSQYKSQKKAMKNQLKSEKKKAKLQEKIAKNTDFSTADWQKEQEKSDIEPTFSRYSHRQDEQAPNVQTPSSFRKSKDFSRTSYHSELESAYKVITHLTPFFYAIMTFILFVSIINRSINGVNFAANLILIIFVVFWDLTEFFPEIREDRVKHAGIPYIIIGLFTLRAFAIGLSLFARGILILIHFIKHTKQISPHHPAVHESKITSILWNREAVRSLGMVLNKLILALSISGILFVIDDFAFHKRGVFYIVYNLIILIITAIVFFVELATYSKKLKLEEIPQEKITIAIIFGILTISNPVGLPLLIWAVSLLIYQDSLKKLEEPLPFYEDIQNLKYHLVAKKNPYYPSIDFNDVSVPKFDPKTGKLKEDFSKSPIKENNGKSSSSIPSESTLASNTNSTDKSNFDGHFNATNQIYTVLNPRNRALLISAPLPTKERDAVARSLIYMSNEQQESYLEEIHAVNQDTLIDPTFIRRINALPLPKNQYQMLIDQLTYLPVKKQEEFVRFLEDSIK